MRSWQPMELWPVVTVALLTADLAASGHAILWKRDSRAAAGWIAVIWGVPVVGAVLYLLLGVNRIRRRAHRLRGPTARERAHAGGTPRPEATVAVPGDDFPGLTRAVDRIAGWPLVPGNSLQLLEDGDAAYPAMLAAIDGAGRSIAMATYLFDVDAIGERFAAALAAAAARGVQVRVLIDAVGARYSRRSMVRHLQQLGVPVAAFLPTRWPWHLAYANLRLHRKLLVVDGAVAFTGGLNVHERSVVATAGARAVRDLHVGVRGPVTASLLAAFAEDWSFSTGERLAGSAWSAPRAEAGPAAARCITDGPDEDFETMRWALLAALGAARRRVRLVTPYFLPDPGLATALGLAALRGVDVRIHLPERGNLRFVQWASTALLWQVLERGCRVFATPPPFDHSKLLLVDDGLAFAGSSNWDPRSLRLNFELDLECRDPAFVAAADELLDRRTAAAREVRLADVDARSLPVRLRDGAARLLQPYL
ncbi:MAG: PLDc N-terminal domain-containing protein [Planctomycetes bacterium]|nr:PLDc N-terminal domain-containing protein [Planctomycetota bacterium]